MTLPITAQELRPALATWEAPASFTHPTSGQFSHGATRSTSSGDYRYEGLAFGGVVFGALGAWIGSRLGVACPTVPGARCDTDGLGNALLVGLTGAAMGGGLGYLVGRFSPKRPPLRLPATDSLLTSSQDGRKRTGYHHWEGLAIGSGGGALLMGLLYAAAHTSCSDCGEGESYFLEAELLSASVGGVLGFLVGLGIPKYESVEERKLPE